MKYKSGAKTRNLGLPYLGSKSKIAGKVIGVLPESEHLYDVFAGGCSISHAALLSGKWEHIHANDLSDAPRLFLDAVEGKYRNEKRWISREGFFALKDSEPYVRCCWSFGNTGSGYIYSRKIEPYKRACHYAVVFDDWGQLAELCPEVVDACRAALRGVTDTKLRRMAFGPAIVRWLKAYGTAEMVECNPLYSSCHFKGGRLERLESLESLESLERLERLERLDVTQLDYRELEFESDSVIYADPPYNIKSGKTRYGVKFDHQAFYDWCCQQTAPLFISEYNMPDDRFVCVAEFEKLSTICATTVKKVVEKIYRPKHQIKE